ncbi:FAD/NAD(P)-binding domain-containing protein [Obba rivulosa]|uniref:FAD/NAD(P)-binding domain-containing protein n=1 Tax=Obba rivulosa TaxID=1052685 RepID=A0A8E2AXL9_9APHY|nr:FAD/NAD(P)-binding domain-containing protein [Obba rivulosa]
MQPVTGRTSPEPVAHRRDCRICVVGAGAAGLITAYTLIQDGFDNVQILSRDASPGGVWAAQRVYPGLTINNVHGEFRFSPLPMPPPSNAEVTGGRLSGEDMRQYMESFAEHFLKGKIRYETEVLEIRVQSDDQQCRQWHITVEDARSREQQVLIYDKVVLCTGGCSEPKIPHLLSPTAASDAGFIGPVLHSSQFRAQLEQILTAAQPKTEDNPGFVLVIGGGKSAQDICAYLANRNRRVGMVFETADAFVAAPIALPGFIRKSRFLAVLSPDMNLRTRLERFLHNTWLGSKIVHGIWSVLQWSSFGALSVPGNSPLRRAHSLFWGIRTNDEGVGRPDGFHALVNAGKIELIAPARAASYGADGHSVVLNDGRVVEADAVILCTGYTSSWDKVFDKVTVEELGLSQQNLVSVSSLTTFGHASLCGAPASKYTVTNTRTSSIYRGIVPARNIFYRDFAINGAIFTTNNGYTFELCAHWISSYFLEDPFLRLPTSIGEALQATERRSAWLRKRYPDMLAWVNQSYSSDIAFWSWPQLTDQLLEDMGLPSMRSGGNWLTWPFKVIDLKEIESLGQERAAKRLQYRTA